jgi:hypothetical protein
LRIMVACMVGAAAGNTPRAVATRAASFAHRRRSQIF